MRSFGAAVLAASLLVTNAFAETPLPAGKPAGVKKAQGWENSNALLIVSGLALAGIGIGFAASSNGGGPTAVTSTPIGSTSTTTGTGTAT